MGEKGEGAEFPSEKLLNQSFGREAPKEGRFQQELEGVKFKGADGRGHAKEGISEVPCKTRRSQKFGSHFLGPRGRAEGRSR